MSKRHLLLLSLSLFILISYLIPLPPAIAQPDPAANAATYGKKMVYTPGQTLQFPDFDLTYLGVRHEQSALFPHGFAFHDFQVERTSQRFTITWSSGTGDIGPTFFAINGRTYRLELVYSAQLAWLANNELVIWQEAAGMTIPILPIR
ncbi:MAG: hypothetical protein KF832_21255 [Caldilineaceae bacterium]|nr:hypothetical protein [Caldilineaceae bacterium]